MRSIRQFATLSAAGTLDPVEAVQECLSRISDFDSQIHAFVWVDAEGSLSAAHVRRDELAAGYWRGPLHGVPIAVKELVDVAGGPNEYGSTIRSGRVAAHDASVVARLRRAGAIIVGTTRSHEFGWGITTQHAERGSTRNPLALDRIPGGSSGGAGAAVAAGMVPACIATDTGGSIRIPSAFCGVAGLKTTFGVVDSAGVVPLAPSFDSVGVIAAHVSDLPLVFDQISDVSQVPEPTTLAPLTNLAGLRVGVAPLLVGAHPANDRSRRYEDAIQLAASLGARIVELRTPAAERFQRAFTVVQGCEAVDVHSNQLGYFPERSSEYLPGVRERLERASSFGLADYLSARADCQRLTVDLVSAMSQVDVLLTPVSLVAPPLVASPDLVTVGDEQIELRAAVMGFTVPQNVAGLPSVAFSAGLAPDGLPVGLQLSAVAGGERTCVAVADLLSREFCV